jgi:hypothetical protein
MNSPLLFSEDDEELCFEETLAEEEHEVLDWKKVASMSLGREGVGGDEPCRGARRVWCLSEEV